MLLSCLYCTGWDVSEDELKEVAQYSNVLDSRSDYLEPDFREKCEKVIPFPADVEPNECIDAYLYLKQNMMQENN